MADTACAKCKGTEELLDTIANAVLELQSALSRTAGVSGTSRASEVSTFVRPARSDRTS
jgi:hypothetical protein